MAPLLLLGATVAALVMGHRHVRPLVVIAVAIGVGTATRIIPIGDVAQSLGPLAEPLAFLTAAVPLSMLLDRIGFFDAAAERVAAHHRLRPSLWVFAAAVTTLFNLDTAIVLLTPLYIRIARRHGLDPLTTAFQPVLLASLASSALPVSNLTNLIVASSTGVGVGDFLVRLAPASIIASTVGWWAFRRTSLRGREPVVIEEPGTPRSRRPTCRSPRRPLPRRRVHGRCSRRSPCLGSCIGRRPGHDRRHQAHPMAISPRRRDSRRRRPGAARGGDRRSPAAP